MMWSTTTKIYIRRKNNGIVLENIFNPASATQNYIKKTFKQKEGMKN